MSSTSIPAASGARPSIRRSRRLLTVAGDDRLVEQVRAGNDAAFEVVFERYGRRLLSFCRHMLGSREEAEDALQHTFAAAYRQLLRDDREVALKPWLYTIARHRCLSMLRARREDAADLGEVATAGLSEQVEARAALRELLVDLAELPDQQRAALLLAEAADLSHAGIATVLDCEAQQVKALIYRARSSLIARRDARALPCGEVREQLATLRGGSLRRLELKYHLMSCHGCREYREQVKRQRRLLATALPVMPTAGLKASVLGALGIGGGASGGGGLLLGGLGISAGASGAAKVAAVIGVAATTAIGAGVVREQTADHQHPQGARTALAPSGAPANLSAVEQPGAIVALRMSPGVGREPRHLQWKGTLPPAKGKARAPEIDPGVQHGRDRARTRRGHDVAPVRRGRAPAHVPPGQEVRQAPPGRDAGAQPPGQAKAKHGPTDRPAQPDAPGLQPDKPRGRPPSAPQKGPKPAAGAPDTNATVKAPPGNARSGPGASK